MDRANDREAFGSRLGDLGTVQAMIADKEIDLDASRALIWQGARLRWTTAPTGGRESSISKACVPEAAYRIADERAVLRPRLYLAAAARPGPQAGVGAALCVTFPFTTPQLLRAPVKWL